MIHRLILKGQLHEVAVLLPRSGLLRLDAPLRHLAHLRQDPAHVHLPGKIKYSKVFYESCLDGCSHDGKIVFFPCDVNLILTIP